MASEFEIIDRYFTREARGALLGIGDDCALIASMKTIAVSTDMLIAGIHFFQDDDPFLLGRKALAVNLSDMAAMGAMPRWATLALALPSAEESWLDAFSKGFMMQAERYCVDLVGGDTTRGPLAICVQIMGEVEEALALKRSGAMAGDEIWVSGTLGDAALGLAHLQKRIVLDEGDAASCLEALRNPVPRVDLGIRLAGISRCAIDLSDGFCADLGHILERSKVSAIVEADAIPLSEVVEKYRENPVAAHAILAGGDDYELCFTAPVERSEEILALGKSLSMRLTRVGKIAAGAGLTLLDAQGKAIAMEETGYEHFR
ncbi:MAG: thiamine-phosphate kinase [Burkholderiales bacterium]|nr:thiamine-phosphate kinase [Burkholderiales bacterium]